VPHLQTRQKGHQEERAAKRRQWQKRGLERSLGQALVVVARLVVACEKRPEQQKRRPDLELKSNLVAALP